MLLSMCERFGCLPSALKREGVSLLRMVRIEALGRIEDIDA